MPTTTNFPVTPAFLHLVLAVQAGRAYQRQLAQLADILHLHPSDVHLDRLGELMAQACAPALAAVGLDGDDATLSRIAALHVPESLDRIPPAELPARYRYDREADAGRGAIVAAGDDPQPDAADDAHIEILQHSVRYWLRGEGAPATLDEASLDHIANSIKAGFREGELCVTGDDGESDFRGWWSIDWAAFP